MPVSEVPAFTETQRFEPWISVLVVVTGIPIPVILGAVMGVRGVLLGIVLVLAPLALLVPARLTTKVTADGFSIQFFPFHPRTRCVPFSEIESVERVQLSASSYGVDWTRKGWSYTAAGTEGVRIRRTDQDLFVGTQCPEERIGALRRSDPEGNTTWSS